MEAYCSFLNMETLMASGSTFHQQCSSCDSAVACSWCVDCREALCVACLSAHRRVTVTRSHQILNQPPAGTIMTPPTKFCRLHPSEPLKLYCCTCRTFTCRDCQLITHMNHRYLFVSEAVSGVKKKLEVLIQPIRAFGDTMRQSMKDMEARLQDIAESQVRLKTEMENSYRVLIQQILSRMEDLLTEAKKVADSEEKQILVRMEKIKQLQKEQESVCDIAATANQSENLPELMKLFTQFQVQLKSISDQDLSPPQKMSQIEILSERAVLEGILRFGILNVKWVPFQVDQSSGPKQTPEPQSVSSQLSTSTSCPPTAPLPLFSSVTPSVPALPAPHEPSGTTNTNQRQVVLQPISQSNSIFQVVPLNRQPGPPQNQPSFLEVTKTQAVYQVAYPLMLSQTVPPSALELTWSKSNAPLQQLKPKTIALLAPATGNQTTGGPSLSKMSQLIPNKQPQPTYQQVPRPQPGPEDKRLAEQQPGPDQRPAEQQTGPDQRLAEQQPGPDQRPAEQQPGPDKSPAEYQLSIGEEPDRKPEPVHIQIQDQIPESVHIIIPDRKPEPVHIQIQDQIPEPVHIQIQDQIPEPVHIHKPDHQPRPSSQKQPDKNPPEYHPEPVHKETLDFLTLLDQKSAESQEQCSHENHENHPSLDPGPAPELKHTKGLHGLQSSALSQRLISDFLASSVKQQLSPVVRAVADSACDSGVQQVALRQQEEPSEDDPTSTVPEEPEPEENLTPEEPESYAEELKLLDSQLNRCQPIVSLYRLPLDLLHQGSPLPGFRLVQGETEDEIYLEEMIEDMKEVQDEDPVEEQSPPESSLTLPPPPESSLTLPPPRESPLTLQLVNCSACRSANGSMICSACGRGFHRDCHVPPVGCDSWMEWICSLCQDLKDPSDPYSSNRPPRPQGPLLSMLEQRRCEKLLLYLKVDGYSQLSQISSAWSHLKTISERLSLHHPPVYTTSAQVLYDIWKLFRAGAEDEVTHLMNSFKDKVHETFSSTPQPEDRHTLTPPAGQGKDSEVVMVAEKDEVVLVEEEDEVVLVEEEDEVVIVEAKHKLSTARKRLGKFLGKSAAKRSRMEHKTPPSFT